MIGIGRPAFCCRPPVARHCIPGLTCGMPPLQRAKRRPKFGSFTPPDEGLVWAWHIVDTHEGRMLLQWQPKTRIWQGEQADMRWTAETAYKHRWVYVEPVLDTQSGVSRQRRRRPL
jgi:hypothetical protein